MTQIWNDWQFCVDVFELSDINAAFNLPGKWEVKAQNDVILDLCAIEVQNGNKKNK